MNICLIFEFYLLKVHPFFEFITHDYNNEYWLLMLKKKGNELYYFLFFLHPSICHTLVCKPRQVLSDCVMRWHCSLSAHGLQNSGKCQKNTQIFFQTFSKSQINAIYGSKYGSHIVILFMPHFVPLSNVCTQKMSLICFI